MEQQLLPMLLALVAGSVGSVALAALLLLLRPVKLQQVSGYLSDLAGGTLLGAASFLTSPEMGVFVTLSVIVHEIPQELGDFGILIQSGMSKNKALLYNALSGSTAILSGVIAYFFMQNMQGFIPYALAFSAASFMYIALAELIPVMHSKTSAGESIRQVLLILVGILIILLIKH